MVRGQFQLAVCLLLTASTIAAEPITIHPRMVHLRSSGEREWSSFPEKAEASQLEARFAAKVNEREHALRLRQVDVKQLWRVWLNDKPLGELVRDENDLTAYFAIPPGELIAGENVVRIGIGGKATPADDIRVGQISLESGTVAEVLGEITIEVEVIDGETSRPIPARLTIVNGNDSLQQTAARSDDRLAVRHGVIYTADGQARLGVPAGKYMIYAGRGFEYSLAKVEASVTAGQTARHRLAIRRQVPTPGYVACDTHIHTLTHSGHGDATIAERMITLAGEGIELPIATDHNVHIDYEPHAQRLNVRQHFTPVMGNEVTTSVGHFNVFPVAARVRVPNHQLKEWSQIFNAIFGTPGVKVAILNHARDLHSGTRPFGPEHFNAVTGENLNRWPLRFNAMEVINSGATQTDPMRLLFDWMALLNRGCQVTPVGSSDSHDVSRFIVGQGRTYIRADDSDPSRINVDAAVANFLQGRVLVSYGLLAELVVNDKYASGDTAQLAGDEMNAHIRVLGPHWTSAERVQLYANGRPVREEIVAPGSRSEKSDGVQWEGNWKLPRPRHDVYLVAIATGKGVDGPYWPTAKPYQPTSPDWQPSTLAASGAVRVDGDGDGRYSCARDYAEQAFAKSGGNLQKLLTGLAAYDAAVAAQAMSLYQAGGGQWNDELQTAAAAAPPQVATGIRDFWQAWRASELARAAR
jgi:hypothetical protein